MAYPENEKRTISWFMGARNIVKFLNDETTYKMSEAVLANFIKFPLAKGDEVEVSIKDGVISFMRKIKVEASESKGSEEAYEPTPDEQAPKETPKPAPTTAPTPAPTPAPAPQVTGEARELTVHGVSADKKAVKFVEIKEEGWFKVPVEIQSQDYNVLGLVGRGKVKVVLSEKNIVSVVKVASGATESTQAAPSATQTAKVEPTPAPKAEQAQKASPKSEVKAPTPQPEEQMTERDAFYRVKELERKIRFLEDNKQDSIEAQCALNASAEIVGRVAASLPQAPTASVINSMVEAVAKANFKLIQNLKNEK